MATVSVRCSIPGGVDYHMMYDDITISSDDYPELSQVKGDDLIRCLQFLATRQIYIWQVAIGFLTREQFAEKMKLVQGLIPLAYKELLISKTAAS